MKPRRAAAKRREQTGQAALPRAAAPTGGGTLPLALVFAVALTARLLYVLSIQGASFFHQLQTEPLHYHRWATLILDGAAPLPPFEQSPGYAYFVAAVYALVGRSLTAVACVQALLDAATCACLVILGRRLFGARAGVIAGLLGAFYGPFIYFTAQLLPSTPFIFLVVAALAAGTRAAAIAGGCLWALAVLVRSEIVVALPFVLLDAWWQGGRRTLSRVAAPIGVCLAATIAFNVAGGGTPALLTTSGGVNLWLGNNPHADGVNPFIYGPLESVAEGVRAQATTGVQADRIFRRQAFAFFRDAPGHALNLLWKKVLWTFTDRELPNTDDIEWVTGHSWLFRWPLFPLRFGMVLPLALAGAVLLGRQWRELTPLLGLLATGVVTGVVFFTNARFRLIMVPPLLLLAGVAVDRFPAMLAAWHQHRRTLALAAASFAMGVVLAWSNFYRVRTYRIPQISVNTGALEREAGRFDDAVRHLREGLGIYPRDAIGWIHLALALEQRGDIAAARQAYRDGQTQLPDDPNLQEMAARFVQRHPQ